MRGITFAVISLAAATCLVARTGPDFDKGVTLGITFFCRFCAAAAFIFGCFGM
jgi:hypothetical protein